MYLKENYNYNYTRFIKMFGYICYIVNFSIFFVILIGILSSINKCSFYECNITANPLLIYGLTMLPIAFIFDFYYILFKALC
jgi:hypothetical protein